MQILNKGKKSPVLVLLGTLPDKTLEGYNVTVIGQKSSDTFIGKTATWLNFDHGKNGAKEMERFIEDKQLTEAKKHAIN